MKPVSSLAALHEASGARMTERHGSRTPADFGDSAAEYDAIRGSAALLDLPWVGVLEFVGPDTAEFLNNMIGADVRDLGEGSGCRSAILTVQGKLVGDTVVLGSPEKMVMLVDANRTSVVAEHLDRFLIADDVEIREHAATHGVIAVSGPEGPRVLSAAGLPASESLWEHEDRGGVTVARIRLSGEPAWALVAEVGALEGIWRDIAAAGAVPAGVEALDVARIESGLAAYGFEADEDRIPLEVGLEETVSTDKGCYLGQETIARVLHRGHVNRALFGLMIDGDSVPRTPCDVFVGDKDAGVLTSSAFSRLLGKVVGLGVLRTKRAAPGVRVSLDMPEGPCEAEVAELPFVDGPDCYRASP